MKNRLRRIGAMSMVLSAFALMSFDVAMAGRCREIRRCCRPVCCSSVCLPVACGESEANRVPEAPPLPPAASEVPPMPSEEPPPAKETPKETPPKPAETGSSAATTPMRLWIDRTGKYRVQARVIEIESDSVRLFKENGVECMVSMDRLSAADRSYVETLVTQYGHGEIGRIAVR